MEEIYSKFGNKIKKCCASCLHNRGAEREKTRICDAGKGTVVQTFSCDTYETRPSLMNAGKGGGRVKRREYLYFLLNHDMPTDPDKRFTFKEAREEFKKKYGDIYINKK